MVLVLDRVDFNDKINNKSSTKREQKVNQKTGSNLVLGVWPNLSWKAYQGGLMPPGMLCKIGQELETPYALVYCFRGGSELYVGNSAVY